MNFKISVTFILCPQKAKTENYGCRAYSFVAPKLWSSLLADIKNAKTVTCFKNKLKTHLFRKARNHQTLTWTNLSDNEPVPCKRDNWDQSILVLQKLCLETMTMKVSMQKYEG